MENGCKEMREKGLQSRENPVGQARGGARQLWGGARALLQLGWHRRVGRQTDR